MTRRRKAHVRAHGCKPGVWRQRGVTGHEASLCESKRHPLPINSLPHMIGLIGQGVYNLKNTGIVNTLFATKNYLVKRNRREGK